VIKYKIRPVGPTFAKEIKSFHFIFPYNSDLYYSNSIKTTVIFLAWQILRARLSLDNIFI